MGGFEEFAKSSQLSVGYIEKRISNPKSRLKESLAKIEFQDIEEITNDVVP